MLKVELTPEGRADPIFSSMPPVQTCLQWHSVRVAESPEGAVVLASSPACRVQAMRLGRHAWSMQYHVEIEPETVDNWGAVPAYRDALESTLGNGALPRLKAEADASMAECYENARQLYRNFRRAIA
jgi:GMP synthase-like glutamine amidotransferase